jgi:hypothetical protein
VGPRVFATRAVTDIAFFASFGFCLDPTETPCTRAFGESLYVYALATNGYGRSSGSIRPSLRAFAITPA